MPPISVTDDIIAARASAAGGSFRGLIRLSGPNVIASLHRLITSDLEKVLQSATAPIIIEGNIFPWNDERPVPATFYYWTQNRGFTGESSLEIHTIGSPPILDAILAAFCRSDNNSDNRFDSHSDRMNRTTLNRTTSEKYQTLPSGCQCQLVRLARPGEFTMRAFLNGRINLMQAEAVLGVIDSVSEKELAISLQQLAGNVALPLKSIRERLLNALILIEAGLDFSEEDISFLPHDELLQIISDSQIQLRRLFSATKNRGISSDKPRIVLTGPPNAGKSTLFNKLIGKSDAIISPIAGTTRDYLEADWICRDTPCILVDTAGLESVTTKEIDQVAMQQANKAIMNADVLICCVETSCELEEFPNKIVEITKNEETNSNTIFIRTKSDSVSDFVNETKKSEKFDWIFVSAKTGMGLESLRDRISDCLQSSHFADVLLPGTALRCQQAIEMSLELLDQTQICLQEIGDESLVALHLRTVINTLGLIDGSVHTDDILDAIFSRFCIGK
ncbi:MAG: tRNA modification GTPase [Thermoguttaceae bacterium]